MWSIACMAKLKVMNSTIGFNPPNAAPTAIPAKPCSVIGCIDDTFGAEFIQQTLGYFIGTLVFGDFFAHQINTSSLPRISSAIASRRASRTVVDFMNVGAFGDIFRGISTGLLPWQVCLPDRAAGCCRGGGRCPGAICHVALASSPSSAGSQSAYLRRHLRCLRDQNLADDTFVNRFEFHRGLVGFDLGQNVAAFNAVAFFDQPFSQACLLPLWAIGRA
jgi:hypothetical protein